MPFMCIGTDFTACTIIRSFEVSIFLLIQQTPTMGILSPWCMWPRNDEPLKTTRLIRRSFDQCYSPADLLAPNITLLGLLTKYQQDPHSCIAASYWCNDLCSQHSLGTVCRHKNAHLQLHKMNKLELNSTRRIVSCRFLGSGDSWF